MTPQTERRMKAPVTNQIMPKYSLETMATINKLKHFGHIMHSSDSMKKDTLLGLTDGSGKKEDSVKYDQQKYEEP